MAFFVYSWKNKAPELKSVDTLLINLQKSVTDWVPNLHLSSKAKFSGDRKIEGLRECMLRPAEVFGFPLKQFRGLWFFFSLPCINDFSSCCPKLMYSVQFYSCNMIISGIGWP